MYAMSIHRLFLGYFDSLLAPKSVRHLPLTKLQKRQLKEIIPKGHRPSATLRQGENIARIAKSCPENIALVVKV